MEYYDVEVDMHMLPAAITKDALKAIEKHLYDFDEAICVRKALTADVCVMTPFTEYISKVLEKGGPNQRS
eukprot:9119933-Karenia_brevis.AAC.1